MWSNHCLVDSSSFSQKELLVDWSWAHHRQNLHMDFAWNKDLPMTCNEYLPQEIWIAWGSVVYLFTKDIYVKAARLTSSTSHCSANSMCLANPLQHILAWGSLCQIRHWGLLYWLQLQSAILCQEGFHSTQIHCHPPRGCSSQPGQMFHSENVSNPSPMIDAKIEAGHCERVWLMPRLGQSTKFEHSPDLLPQHSSAHGGSASLHLMGRTSSTLAGNLSCFQQAWLHHWYGRCIGLSNVCPSGEGHNCLLNKSHTKANWWHLRKINDSLGRYNGIPGFLTEDLFTVHTHSNASCIPWNKTEETDPLLTNSWL